MSRLLDTTNPFAYFSQEQVEEHGNEDTVRQVSEYDPAQEFVVALQSPATAPAPTGCATFRQDSKRIRQTKSRRATLLNGQRSRSSPPPTWRR